MFEQAIDSAENNSRTRILIIASVALAMLAAIGALLYRAFILHQQMPAQSVGLVGALKAGAPDFDNYIEKNISITNQEVYYSINALGGNQIVAKGRVQNFGNKTIKGLEVRAVAYDFNHKPLSERLIAAIPNISPAPLAPNDTLPIIVKIDNAPKEDLVQDIKLEVHGLIFQ